MTKKGLLGIICKKGEFASKAEAEKKSKSIS